MAQSVNLFHEWLEVANPSYPIAAGSFENETVHTKKQVAYNTEKQTARNADGIKSPNPNNQIAWSRRKWLILGGVNLLIFILTAVLGGVLGSKKHKKSGASGLSQSPPPSGSSHFYYPGNIAAT